MERQSPPRNESPETDPSRVQDAFLVGLRQLAMGSFGREPVQPIEVPADVTAAIQQWLELERTAQVEIARIEARMEQLDDMFSSDYQALADQADAVRQGLHGPRQDVIGCYIDSPDPAIQRAALTAVHNLGWPLYQLMNTIEPDTSPKQYRQVECAGLRAVEYAWEDANGDTRPNNGIARGREGVPLVDTIQEFEYKGFQVAIAAALGTPDPKKVKLEEDRAFFSPKTGKAGIADGMGGYPYGNRVAELFVSSGLRSELSLDDWILALWMELCMRSLTGDIDPRSGAAFMAIDIEQAALTGRLPYVRKGDIDAIHLSSSGSVKKHFTPQTTANLLPADSLYDRFRSVLVASLSPSDFKVTGRPHYQQVEQRVNQLLRRTEDQLTNILGRPVPNELAAQTRTAISNQILYDQNRQSRFQIWPPEIQQDRLDSDGEQPVESGDIFVMTSDGIGDDVLSLEQEAPRWQGLGPAAIIRDVAERKHQRIAAWREWKSDWALWCQRNPGHPHAAYPNLSAAKKANGGLYPDGCAIKPKPFDNESVLVMIAP